MGPDAATTSQIPIVCNLGVGDYKERLAQIAELARDALRSYERDGLVLHLRYDAAAADQVKEMVRRERDCCALIAALTSVTDPKTDIGPLISVLLFLSELEGPPPAAP